MEPNTDHQNRWAVRRRFLDSEEQIPRSLSYNKYFVSTTERVASNGLPCTWNNTVITDDRLPFH